ncbi:UDP-glucose 4-epimerase GalE [Polynucleobacter sp. AP-Titi-500A-B4]|uniref:UDP-glucose 4-epimerase GalE n=1 Tax=Polynucleobacter sp. AP-Titi-500A-B4 TaxID=2576923 RepID=UPI001BFDCB0A|nr:UDP-glucose 4-epimerase GalE [Polynucleobacter sp. AP-Titi-500A-B4]QWE12775.1 UDP-glucose 4-epimerase GalE [Polynucleobacter sp. AP-Titi-500A-B4]
MGKVLVTGGAGYIGSHTVIQLAHAGLEVAVLDNLSNSSRGVIARLEELTGKTIQFIHADVRDRDALRAVFSENAYEAVIHFAGLKAVSESQNEPLKYFDNNVSGSIVLFEEMMNADISKLIFSSSATVYGDPGCVCYAETTPLKPINVYGQTKLMVEDILRDIKWANPQWQIALLRYFNPVGAHESGRIGESPFGTPNNLMPFISQVAVGKREKLMVYGNDYPTPDGTGLRDYIHVDDLAAGHLAALNALSKDNSLITVNLGTGKPNSVLEMISAFEKASGVTIPYEIIGRRSGDLPEYYADAHLAKKILNWEAKLGIDRMCADTWRWQKNNPNGYCDQ